MLWCHGEAEEVVRGRGGGRGGANRCLPLSVAFCDVALHPSTSSSPSRYRRPPSRSPALSADSVLENVKSDFAREVFVCVCVFVRWQEGRGADDARPAQTVRQSACLFFAATRSHFCAREGARARPCLESHNATSHASVCASPAGIEGTQC